MTGESKLKVLVVPDLFPKDVLDVKGIFVTDYLRCLSGSCDQNVFVVRNSGKQKGIFRDKKYGSEIIELVLSATTPSSLLKSFHYFNYINKAVKILKREAKPDIIHAHGSILSGAIALRLSKHWNIPFVVTEHAGPFSVIKNNFWKFRWTKYVLERADAALFVSHHAQVQILSAGIRAREIFVTYNPVDTDRFRPADLRRKKILFASRLDAFKGALQSLRCFQSLSDKYPDWQLCIMGEGEEAPQLKTYLNQYPSLSGRVKIREVMRRDELAEEMRESCFFVFPSKHETFGLVAAEALSAGLPVIAGKGSAMNEYIHERNGILVKHGDEVALTTAMEKMIKEADSYDRTKLREEMISRFGYEASGKRLLDIYKSVIGVRK